MCSWFYATKMRLFFFVSNSLQEVIIHVDFFAALSTDHSPVTIWISKNKNCIHAHGFWQFNSYLLSDQNYVRKNLIQTFHSNQNVIPNAQIKWELLKYEIQKCCVELFKSQLSDHYSVDYLGKGRVF